MSGLIKDDFFLVGSVVNTQGMKGDVRVIPATDEPSRFGLLKSVFVKRGENESVMDIERVWYHKQFVIIKFVSIDDMNAAEKLKWAQLYIKPEDALPLGDDEYYTRDLFGMGVVTEDGETLGVIDDIIQTGANDVYSVCKKGEKNRLLLPAIKQCILSVDTRKRVMVVRLMEGLL